MLAGPPEKDIVVPAVVADLAGGRSLRAVWLNQLGGLTFEIGTGADRCFVKWAPAGSGLDLPAEAARMVWARPISVVPVVLDAGENRDGAWLMTAPLAGQSAVDEQWKRQPAIAVAAIGSGLRHLHDHAPTDGCPFSWSADERVATAVDRAGGGLTNPKDWHVSHQMLTVSAALAIVRQPPPVDRLVVCHGDACAPNTMVDGGQWSGQVDLGALGVADRADLAIATWSTEWNYGPGWEKTLLDAYGIDPDPERTAYYRLLWDLT